MRKALLAAAALLVAVGASAAPARFIQFPDIHGDTIVFTWEGDLWQVGAGGGAARRLTSHPGTEESARFSPDGRFIAFAGGYDGGTNVYTIPAGGGEPARVTWHGSNVQPVAWTPDGRIVFRSSHENTFRPMTRLYTVSREGELPEPLPVDRGVLCSFSPDGSQMVYNRRGREEYYWKRYKGGQYLEIWRHDFKAKSYEMLTDYVGKNAYPMWAGERMLFVSDRGENGVSNLYSYDFASKKIDQLTRYTDFDVQTPSTDGRRVVFTQAGRLHLLEIATGTDRVVEVDVASDRWRLAERTINPKDFIQSMSVSNDGATAVFEARGDVFLVPTDEQLSPVNVTRAPGSRERFPRLSPDGRKVAFFSDRSGEYQLYLADVAAPEKPWEQLTTTLDRAVYHLAWSPDGSKILFGNKDFAVFFVDVASRRLVKVDASNMLKNDEFFWEVSDYVWSPDSRWIAYSFVQPNRNNRVFLYSLEQARSFPVTSDFYDSLNPAFDADGEYLFFLSYRNFDPQLDVFEDNHIIPAPVQVMAVQLKAGNRPPFQPRPRDEKKAEPGAFRIDLDGLAERAFPLPVDPGNFFYLKAGKGYVTWAATDAFSEVEFDSLFTPSGRDTLKLHVFDLAAGKEVVHEKAIADWRLSANGEHMITTAKNAYHVTPLAKAYAEKKPGEEVPLDKLAYRVAPREEWKQIFEDTWRWYRDFFYAGNFHGRDWKAMGAAYRAMVPELSSRAELNWLLSQMVGELNVSHTYVGGGDMGPDKAPEVRTYTGLLGADLVRDASGYHKVARLLGPTAYDRGLTAPLVRPDVAVKVGDLLVAIDGREVKAPDNPYRHLQVVKGQKVRLSFNARPTLQGATTVEVEPLRSEHTLRYARWLADNVDKVLAASGGELGYMHITAMGADNVGQFDKFWRAFRYKKGIVIDVRGNGGGWTEYFMIDKLERQQVGYNVLRGMEPYRYPNSASSAHYVVVSNEYNGSDGEAFIEHFKARGLGTVVGVPSWGGLVGIINGQLTIDNGRVHQSNNSFYGREGQWWVENHGSDPDILVDNDPASAMAGRDAQLEKAVEVALEKIRTSPVKPFPPVPQYPVR